MTRGADCTLRAIVWVLCSTWRTEPQEDLAGSGLIWLFLKVRILPFKWTDGRRRDYFSFLSRLLKSKGRNSSG